MPANHGEMSHAQVSRFTFDNHGQVMFLGFVAGPLALNLLKQKAPIDLKKDFKVTRENFPEQRLAPSFQGFGKQGVVGVGKGSAGAVGFSERAGLPPPSPPPPEFLLPRNCMFSAVTLSLLRLSPVFLSSH